MNADASNLREGLIRLGRISNVHEQGHKDLRERVEIVAVCNVDENLCRKRAAPHKAKVYADYYAMVRESEMDLIDITFAVAENIRFIEAYRQAEDLLRSNELRQGLQRKERRTWQDIGKCAR